MSLRAWHEVTSEIEIADVAGVGRDEVAARLDVVAHQHAHDVVGLGGLFDCDLQQGAGARVHGGRLQLFPVHLAETLQAGEVLLVVPPIDQETGLAGIVFAVALSTPLLIEYSRTGLVDRLPTAILSTGIVVVSMLSITAGVILDSIRRMRAETKRMFYNMTPSGFGEKR